MHHVFECLCCRYYSNFFYTPQLTAEDHIHILLVLQENSL